MEEKMNEKNKKRISKKMSLALRHQPDAVGLTLEDGGWANVDALVMAFTAHGLRVNRANIEEVVETNDKQRFEFDQKRIRVRARQGHSLEIELGYEPATPPDVLLHGTAEKNVGSIMTSGIHKARRHAVHLSTDAAMMLAVGGRHGKPTLLEIDSAAMHEAGFQFYLTGNGVWLTDEVPPEFIRRIINQTEMEGAIT